MQIKNFIIEKGKQKEKNQKKLEGTFAQKDFLSPSYINLSNPKYIEIDNLFYYKLLS